MKCGKCERELPENGYAEQCLEPTCAHDGKRFEIEVENIRQFLNPVMLDKISKNEMPACFAFTRETGVAMARLLMEALRQNEEMLKALGQGETRH